MSTNRPVITRPRQMAGEYRIEKHGTGRHRVRLLVFSTIDGFEGVSRKWDRQEAYDNALKVRAKAKASAPSAQPASAPLLRAVHESDLCAELERRGYAVCPAEQLGLDLNGELLATAERIAA